jgi:hypothetical protein
MIASAGATNHHPAGSPHMRALVAACTLWRVSAGGTGVIVTRAIAISEAYMGNAIDADFSSNRPPFASIAIFCSQSVFEQNVAEDAQ